MKKEKTDLDLFYHLRLCTHDLDPLYSRSYYYESTPISGVHRPNPMPFLLLWILNNSCLFCACSRLFFQTISSPISLWCFPSKFMPHSLPPHPLTVAITQVLPSYFILTLPLIRPSISHVHSSLSLFFSPPYSLSSPLPYFILSCFFVSASVILFLNLLSFSLFIFSLVCFHAALS